MVKKKFSIDSKSVKFDLLAVVRGIFSSAASELNVPIGFVPSNLFQSSRAVSYCQMKSFGILPISKRFKTNHYTVCFQL